MFAVPGRSCLVIDYGVSSADESREGITHYVYRLGHSQADMAFNT